MEANLEYLDALISFVRLIFERLVAAVIINENVFIFSTPHYFIKIHYNGKKTNTRWEGNDRKNV